MQTRSLFLPVCLIISACTATVPESVYRADLDKQTSDYERRLRSLEELRVRQQQECREAATREESKLRRVAKRLHRCELKRPRPESEPLVVDESQLNKQSAAITKRLERLFRGIRVPEATPGALKTKFVIPADPWFEPGSVSLAGEAESWLTELASLLIAEESLLVTIGAHSDSIGTPKENWDVTAGQSIAVAMKLIQLGVIPARIGVTAFGRYTPRASNDTREGRSENRRIQFVFSTVQSQSSHGTKNVEGN